MISVTAIFICASLLHLVSLLFHRISQNSYLISLLFHLVSYISYSSSHISNLISLPVLFKGNLFKLTEILCLQENIESTREKIFLWKWRILWKIGDRSKSEADSRERGRNHRRFRRQWSLGGVFITASICLVFLLIASKMFAHLFFPLLLRQSSTRPIAAGPESTSGLNKFGGLWPYDV